jgi:hypothetical protein
MAEFFGSLKVDISEDTAPLRTKVNELMRFRCFIIVALSMFLAGCDQAALMKKFVPPDAESADKEYVEQLQHGKFDQIERDLDPSLSSPGIADAFAKMTALFPAGTPKSIKVVGAHTTHLQEFSRVDLTFEYEFAEKWLIVNIVTQKQGEASTIVGFRVTPISDSLENLNRFSLRRKSALQYFMLLCAAGSFAFSLYAFVICIRSKDMKPKWLWLIIALVGVGKLAVNWGTDEYAYQLIAISVPSFQMTRAFYGPWIVTAYVPVGAIVFLHVQWKKKISGKAIPPPVLPLSGENSGA